MKYPITEAYIAAMRLEFGPNKAAEEAHQAIIPVVNAAYAAGLRGGCHRGQHADEQRRPDGGGYLDERVQDGHAVRMLTGQQRLQAGRLRR